MSEQNRLDGQRLYALGDAETRDWFERQWRIWPERADERLTTNLSLHYGGVIAYRIEHNQEPQMSSQFRSNVYWLDKNTDQTPLPRSPKQTERRRRTHCARSWRWRYWPYPMSRGIEL